MTRFVLGWNGSKRAKLSSRTAASGSDTVVRSIQRISMNNQWLKETWEYRELFYFFVWRDIKVKYKQSLLGVGWAFIQPLFTMIIFTLFFGRFANVPSDGIPYPVFSYAALLPWTLFANSISLAANSLVSNAGMINKVYFPRMALPVGSVISGVLDFGIASVLLVALMIYYKIAFTSSLLLLPFVVAALLVLAMGMGMFLAALQVRYRDIKYALPFIVQLWLFVTPVIYPVTLIPDQFRPFIALNPLAGIIDGFRACVFPSRSFDVPLIATSAAVTIAVFSMGVIYFRRTERWFADII
jgi:lipopolysaccharide transport system permease protein